MTMTPELRAEVRREIASYLRWMFDEADKLNMYHRSGGDWALQMVQRLYDLARAPAAGEAGGDGRGDAATREDAGGAVERSTDLHATPQEGALPADFIARLRAALICMADRKSVAARELVTSGDRPYLIARSAENAYRDAVKVLDAMAREIER